MFVRELNIEECQLALAQAGFGRLACARDNQPYVVPIHFAVDEAYVYAFSLAGQKLDWMRKNPRVCLEIDDVHGASDWTSVVVFAGAIAFLLLRRPEPPPPDEPADAVGAGHTLTA